MKLLKKEPLAKLGGHFEILLTVLNDQLFLKFGFEHDILQRATDEIGLEDDSEFKAMENEH